MFQRRILLTILIPVVGIGIAIAGLSYFLLVTPLVAWLTDQTERYLTHASDTAISICDERFSDLMDLRLEDDPEMLAALREEALSEIMNLHNRLPQLEIFVLNDEKRILGTTVNGKIPSILNLTFDAIAEPVDRRDLFGKPARLSYRYFPFWRWHILSVIFDEEFNVAIDRATRVVTFGTFGVLLVVLASVTLLFYWCVNRPLQKIIQAAHGVAEGRLKPVDVHRPDEIGQVTLAFNNMIAGLREEKRKTKQMMSELRDSEEQYRVLTENSLALVVMVQKGHFIFANRCTFESFQYASEEFMGLKAVDLIHPRDRDRVMEIITNLETGRLALDHLEFRCHKKSGEEVWLESIASLVLVNEKYAVLIHSIDVTQRKSESIKRRDLEEKLSRAQKMEAIGMLAGGVAHDLNNILGGLVSYPELLLMDLPEDSTFREPLTVIYRSGLRAAAIVQDLLTLSRRGVAVAENIDLNTIVNDYLESPEHEKLKSFHPGVSFEVVLDPNAKTVQGSPVHLSKTLINLVSNAAEAMARGGAVTIRTGFRELKAPLRGYESVESGTYSLLSVADLGIGISDEDQKHIFEPFYTKKAMGRSGTGLGMAVVWGTTKDHDGFIDMTSAPGQGTQIDLYFPAKETASALTHHSQTKPVQLKGSETILVVDDVDEQLLIGRGMLSLLGYKVETVSSGEEAVIYLQSNNVDLVVLDMIMDPGMDGLETYRQIIKFQPGQKAIITSGYSETDRVFEAQRLGVGAYVKKPYVLEALGKAVRNELDRRS